MASELPPGVRLFSTLTGSSSAVRSLAFDPQGDLLASGHLDGIVTLWHVPTGKAVDSLRSDEADGAVVNCLAFGPRGDRLVIGGVGDALKVLGVKNGAFTQQFSGQTAKHFKNIHSVAFNADGQTLASGTSDGSLFLWKVQQGAEPGMPRENIWALAWLRVHGKAVNSVTFDHCGTMLASGGDDSTARLFDVATASEIRTLAGHGDTVSSVAFDPRGKMLASGSWDSTVKLWELPKGRLLRTLEGHTAGVEAIAFSPDGRLLASRSDDRTIRLWDCESWETAAVITEPTDSPFRIHALAFHPTLPMLATASSQPDTPPNDQPQLIHLFELDPDLLLRKKTDVEGASSAVQYVTAKIVLVGDHGVGKSALGYRLIHGVFKEQAATHGQQFWPFPALGGHRADGTECEAILWDFAGQPDYRLVHALFIDDADLALILFDASDLHDPLRGVGFWVRQLRVGATRCPTILVAAITDRGSCPLTPQELAEFCCAQGIVGPISTSAATGRGIAELIERMRSMIPWDEKAATVTTATFKRVKDYVLGLKKVDPRSQTIVTFEELRLNLQASDRDWHFTDAEMRTAVAHLENYGYVKRLRTSEGRECILLEPERLNNLASSFVLEARRNPKGLGALEERSLIAGGYDFPELRGLPEDEGRALLDSAALLFLEHNLCFREIDPLRVEPYLVFPELINLKRPLEDEKATEEGAAYTVTGPTENVFASLVVLLGYTHTFRRTSQWRMNARYEVGDGQVCGFRLEAERDGELDFVLCFDPTVGTPVRTLFQGLFESFLARRNLTVMRYEPVWCTNPGCRHRLDRSIVRQMARDGRIYAFCNECGQKLPLLHLAERIQLTRASEASVTRQRQTAEQRTCFEQAIFQVQAYVAAEAIPAPECFISYAWGVPEHERWVEKRLATDLQKAGILVLLDRWHNVQIGSSVARFVERIEKSDRVVVVGTPLYRRKYENRDTETGYVVAAEVDLIDVRLLGTELQKQSVLPLLLDGDEMSSLPPFLRGRVFADFRDESAYFVAAFDLILRHLSATAKSFCGS